MDTQSILEDRSLKRQAERKAKRREYQRRWMAEKRRRVRGWFLTVTLNPSLAAWLEGRKPAKLSMRVYVERLLEKLKEADAGPKMPVVGRNAPCPCGSGKKAKACCQAAFTSV